MTKHKDLIGERFGKLTVIEKTEEKQDNYWVWKCQCDCGGKILVNTKRLVRGTVSDCGCVPKKTARNGSIAENLTGQQFGMLKVLYHSPNQKGRTCWLCQCSCGNIRIASAHDLKSGKVQSCGCLRHRKGQGIRNLAGQQFGRLTALSPTDQRDKKGSVMWHCRCSCGTELNVSEDGLVHGNYKSCGCLQREIQQNIVSCLTHIDDTCIEWLEKRKFRRDNTSGFRGVSQKKNGSYRVTIGFKKKRFYIGVFKDFNEAVRARLEAEELIHGGFLRAYYQWKEEGKEKPLVFDVRKVNGEFHIISNF